MKRAALVLVAVLGLVALLAPAADARSPKRGKAGKRSVSVDARSPKRGKAAKRSLAIARATRPLACRSARTARARRRPCPRSTRPGSSSGAAPADARSPSAPATPPPTAAPAPTPLPSSAPSSSGLTVGINSNSDVEYTPPIIGRLGARVVRVEWTIGTPVEQMRPTIAAFADNGARVVPLATFWARTPSQAEARSVADWAREFGPSGAFWRNRADGRLAVREIEFGNETSYQYQYGDTWADPSYSARAREYALRAKDAADALAGTGVGLLVQAEDGGTRSANWVDGMFAAVPDLDRRIAGWTVHAYGPAWQDKVDRLVAQTRAAGASDAVPLHMTEWGLATDGGRCLNDNYGWNRCMGFDEAARTVDGVVAALRSRYGSRFRSLLVYQSSDQRAPGATVEREHYFGALRRDGSDKGAYTAALRRHFAG